MLVDINGLHNSTYIDVSYSDICAELFLDRKQTKNYVLTWRPVN
jgi:hypothetical protein